MQVFCLVENIKINIFHPKRSHCAGIGYHGPVVPKIQHHRDARAMLGGANNPIRMHTFFLQ